MYIKLRRIFALIVLAVFALSLVSCKESGTDYAKKFIYTDVNAIPESDIAIAYIHAKNATLADSVNDMGEKFRFGKERIFEFDINNDGTLDDVLNRAFSFGCNVIIFDRGIKCDDASAQIKANPDKFFIAYCDDCGNSDNLICFEDSYLEYNYILGVISAKITKSDKIGINAEAPKSAEEFAQINAFAAGVRIVNSNIGIIVSKNERQLSSERCDIVFIPAGESASGYGNRAVGYNIGRSAAVSLKTDHTGFLNYIISSISDGSFSGNTEIEVGVNYGLCDNSLSSLTLDETFKAQIKTIEDYFIQGMKIFSNNALMISGDEIISVTEPVIDTKGSTMIDDMGNCYYYIDDEIRTCNDYETLITEKMNYLYDNVEIK